MTTLVIRGTSKPHKYVIKNCHEREKQKPLKASKYGTFKGFLIVRMVGLEKTIRPPNPSLLLSL